MKALILSAALSVCLSTAAVYVFTSPQSQQRLWQSIGFSTSTDDPSDDRPRRKFDANNRPARSE